VRVGLKPKQIKYLNSTAARLQPNEKEEMGSSGVQLQDAEACRSEAGDEENEQEVEPNEKEKQDSGRDHPHYLGRVVVGDERPPLVGLCAAVNGHCCSLLTPMETNGERRVNVHTRHLP